MEQTKIIEVIEALGVDTIESIEIIDDMTISIDNEEYLVLDEDERDDIFRSNQEDLINDMGLDAFSDMAKEYILNNCIDVDWFEDAMKESYEFYMDDIRNENASDDNFDNRLDEEINDNGCNNEEEYLELLCSYYDSGIDWYKDNFGEKELSQTVINNNLLDIDSIIDYIIEVDGYGYLASYDGQELESNSYYIYRTN